MQKHQEVYSNIVKIYQPEMLMIELKNLQAVILPIYLFLKQKSQVKLEIAEQKMLK